MVGLKDGTGGLVPSSPRELFPLTARTSLGSPFEVSPDGKRILVNQVVPNTELDVVLNWPAMLRRQAAQ